MATINFNSRHSSSTKVSDVHIERSVRDGRVLKYSVECQQTQLNLYKRESAPELYALEKKIHALIARWDKQADDHLRRSRIAASKESCDSMSAEAAAKLEMLGKILEKSINQGAHGKKSLLLKMAADIDKSRFWEPAPKRLLSSKPEYAAPMIRFADRLLGRKSKKINQAMELHETELRQWEVQDKANEDAHAQATAAWRVRADEFEKNRREEKQKIDNIAEGIKDGNPQSIAEHAGIILDASDYGDFFEKSFEIEYEGSPAKILQIAYELPSIDGMPTLRSVRFIQSTGEVKETHIAERERKSNFDSTCYQICLRTIHELFEEDNYDNIGAIIFNGYSTSINEATGHESRSCIMSVLVKKADFQNIDLRRVEPKACFKSLKGVSASSLAALAPIAPVMELNKEDRRFIDAREIIAGLDNATNIAAMEWGDFEHLIRELFEREFASRGGEVKITQASGDGGVDAVAFDPDPITGGKIVIQAKRYTKTVGVSAVRDLYGTMQHEGASRGILISTADYGPDAHQFASGKPISLFSGSHLLHLLEKHGYNAKIDLQAARKDLNLRGA